MSLSPDDSTAQPPPPPPLQSAPEVAADDLALLGAAQAGDSVARARFCERNSGLVYAAANRVARHLRGTDEFEDLVQEGWLGLLTALKRFDPARGVKFSTFATPCIEGSIKTARRKGGLLKITRSMHETHQAVRKAHEYLMQDLGRQPTIAEIANRAQVPEDEVRQVLADLHDNVVSLDELCEGAESDEAGAWEPGEDDPFISRVVERRFLAPVLDRLPKNQRDALIDHYFKGKSVKEIAEERGWTETNVKTLLRRGRLAAAKVAIGLDSTLADRLAPKGANEIEPEEDDAPPEEDVGADPDAWDDSEDTGGDLDDEDLY